MGLRFEHPAYLVLLAVIPLIIAMSLRSLSGLGGWRRGLAIALRSGVVSVLVLALAGAQCARTSDELNVIFLLDRSRSVPRSEQDRAFAMVQKAQESLDALHDRFGVVVFNGASAVEQLPMSALGLDALSDPPQPDQTNVAAALRMATALFRGDTMRRIVLLSDGNQNVGEALEEAARLGAAGVPIDVSPLRYEHRNEVVFERLAAPATASAEETINLQMVLRSQQRTSGRILLYHNDELVDLDPGPGAGYPVQLNPGYERFQIPVPLRVAGAHRFRAVFEPDAAADDSVVANNEGRAFTVVSGQGRILLLTTEADRESALVLARALERERLVCDVELAGGAPLDQVRLIEYSAVILSNVARHYLSAEAEKALAVYVRELGGGLVMIGGDEAFGAGGWMDSPIEDVMPVSFDIKSKRQIPKGALALIMHACEIPEGNYWGVRVAVEAVKTLSSRDLVGVLQYEWRGADNGHWLVPLREVGNKTQIIQTISGMNQGDLPDLDTLMRPAAEALAARTDAGAKHMIIVSDFDPMPPTDSTLQLMQKHGITCSSVAIGFGGHPIDVNKAQMIANVTGGKYYDTRDPQKLPQIFIKEAQIVRRSLINESRFVPQLTAGYSPVISGFDGGGFPSLGGYVLTTAKDLAQLPLVRQSEDGLDPVLAHWQVGLGKTVAFTSGMWPRWGQEWAAWPSYGRFWAQLVRWASRQAPGAAFDVTTTIEGGKGRIRVDARNKNVEALNFMTIAGTLVDPQQNAARLALTQTGPGQYEGEFDARDAGSYVINVAYQQGAGEGAAAGSLQAGVSVAYSPEFRELRANEAFLSDVAQRSGSGRVLTQANLADVFDRTGLPPAETRRSVWEDLLRLMLLLFLLDVAVRRLAINPLEMVRRLRQRIAEAGRVGATAAGSAATLAGLKGAREGAAGALRGAGEAEQAAAVRTARYSGPESASEKKLADALGGASELNAPVVAAPPRKLPSTSQGDYTSRLLKAKREARETLDDENTPSS